MCQTKLKIASLAAAILVSACASKDPIMLLPPVERGYLKTLISQDKVAAQKPISVAEMLKKVRATDGAAAEAPKLAVSAPVLELRFHPTERAVSDRHFSKIEQFRNALTTCDGCKIVIELPTHAADPLLHYQRAISTAKRLAYQTSSIRIKIRKNLTPHLLKLKVSAGAS